MTLGQAILLRDAINGALNVFMNILEKGEHIYFTDVFINMKHACDANTYLEKRSIEFTAKFHRLLNGAVLTKFKFLKT